MAESAQVPLAPKFQIITKAIGPGPQVEGGDGRRRFHAVASSTLVDRSGDSIDVNALHKMAAKFREGLTVFRNHKYRDVDMAYGVTDSAQVIQRGLDPETGAQIWDLEIGGLVNTFDPAAVRLADAIDAGLVKLGTSISAFVRKHTKDPKTGGMAISDLDVFEASIVGVPDQPRSWAKSAAMAIKSFGGAIEDEEDEPVADETSGQIDNDTTPPGEKPDDAGAEPEGAAEEPAPADPVTTGSDAAPAADDTQESAEASAEASGEAQAEQETPSEETPQEETPGDAPDVTAEKAFSAEDVKDMVGWVQKAVPHIARLESENEALRKQVAQFEADAQSITKEVSEARAVIEKTLQMPLRSQTASEIEKGLPANGLFAQFPDIADFLNKRSKLSGN